MNRVYMAEQLHTRLTSLCTILSVVWNGEKHYCWTLEQWKCVLWSDEPTFSIESLMDKFVFDEYQENPTEPDA